MDACSGTAAMDASMGIAQNALDALPAGRVNDEIVCLCGLPMASPGLKDALEP